MAQPITEELVFKALPARAAEAHKGRFGRLVCAAGSSAYRGAALLAAEGALRVGAGIVTLASVEPVVAAAAARLPECTFLPLGMSGDGGIGSGEAARLRAAADSATALLFGPGLGNTADTAALLRAAAPGVGCPLVLDADGLNAAAALGRLPKPDGAPLVITPHPGEMARLCGLSAAAVNADRQALAARFARAWGCVVVLKGHGTIVAGPGGEVYRNTTGGPGLARGGSGDALAGMLAGLLAQGLDALSAAIAAVWLHGAAADACAAKRGSYGMLPHDLFSELGALFARHGR